ncbi:Pseudooxynicotine oxidase [Streptomyces sp. ADI95-16]|uniref:flavin monoamine oxidase family protein n=1 Tax=Streptomyces sp. ADI95-16 TaxID=1522758 RepID=UPI000F437046|nr:NAD(P)/FAD-dependent oxidoreductase [Streptomyces sp. ADI95-16]AYV25201.1 Pseudooxynicotine oxidase [Streptomyces sp. ADI95-16]
MSKGESRPDAVIIGGGFAGVTAARELTMRGRRTVLVESRDRLGGRTYTKDHDGHPMEFGGTWVHPLQPNVWAEIQRYGLETEPLPVMEGLRQAVVSGGRVVDLSDDDVARAMELLDQFCSPGRTLFPEPYTEAWGPDPQGIGDRSFREQLATVKADPVLYDWLEAMCCAVALGPLDKSAVTEYLRTYALSGWSAEQASAALTATKLVKGTRELIDGIAGQATLADIRLNSHVTRVVQSDGEVRVELADGDTITAPTAVIALPMNVLNSVEFEPRLSDTKRRAADERHAGAGRKSIVKVKGDIGNVSVLAPEAYAVNWVVTYAQGGPEGTWVVAFSSNPDRLPMSAFDDTAGMQEALQPLLPGVEVESIVGWDWSNDPLSLGTWCIYRPGQLAGILPDLRTTEGRLFFAGADSAIGWRSFIDGAIQSGYHTARHIDDYLNNGSR